MGWLQGLRFRNEQQIRESWEHMPLTPGSAQDFKANAMHVENSQNTNTKGSSPHIRGDVSGSIKTEAELQRPNELESLLAATFERPRTRNQELTSNSEARVVASHWPFQDGSVSDKDLPYITTNEIMSRRLAIDKGGPTGETQREGLWIVVDNIVYDCSNFAHDHPGGKQVILSFVGEDCSWQFWRFHSRRVMDEYGKRLRIGKAEKVPNRFEERPKYIGLSLLGHDECY